MNANRQATVIKGNNKERTMRITASSLIRWAGLSAMVAGIFYVVVGLFHPLETLSSATTPRWIIVHTLATAMCFFGLLGMAGLYARQVKAVGWLGLAGFLLLSLFYALTAPFTFVEAVILPLQATTAPTFVEGFLGLFNRHPTEMNLGVLAALYSLSGIVYIFGGLLFGFATFRAGILPRWAAGLLAVGVALSPVAALLPLEYKALVAVPVGLALAWLGYALWSERREHASDPVPGRGSPSSAKPQPSKLAGNGMEWTSGRVAACLIGNAIVARSSASDGDVTPHHLARSLRNARCNAHSTASIRPRS